MDFHMRRRPRVHPVAYAAVWGVCAGGLSVLMFQATGDPRGIGPLIAFGTFVLVWILMLVAEYSSDARVATGVSTLALIVSIVAALMPLQTAQEKVETLSAQKQPADTVYEVAVGGSPFVPGSPGTGPARQEPVSTPPPGLVPPTVLDGEPVEAGEQFPGGATSETAVPQQMGSLPMGQPEEAFPSVQSRGFLPVARFNAVPVRTSDWLQIRGWTVFYRYALFLGTEDGEYAQNCTRDLRVVGDWDWNWRSDGIGVTCIDDEWLSFDLSALRGRLAQPTRLNIRGRADGVWGLHGHTRFLAPCILSELGSYNLWVQATAAGVRLVRPASVDPADQWIFEPQNSDLDVCRGGRVAVAQNSHARPFRRSE